MSIPERLFRSKLLVVTLLVLPGLWPVWPIFVREDFSVLADPLKYVLHHLGFTASVILALVLTLSGALVLTIGGRDVQTAPQTMVRMPANVPHAVRALEPSRMLLIMLREASSS